MNGIENTEISVQIESIKAHPYCEMLLNKMFWATLLPLVNSKSIILRYIVPLLTNLILGSAAFCLLFYPQYYATDGEIWTTDMVIIIFTYNYMIYLFKRWDIAQCAEPTNVPKSVNRISLVFYWLYIIYWLYFAIIQFYTHSYPSILYQFGNILMSTAWYFFFSIAAVIYYYICVKLSQRSHSIRAWLKDVKKTKPSLEEFYIQYNKQYKIVKELGKYWNVLIFVGSLLLTLHVPIDLISIIYRKYYFDILGFIIKLISLFWYIWRVCDLNDYDLYIVSYLHKHRLYDYTAIEELSKYIEYRPVGLNFFGIKINKPLIVKFLLILINLVIPTMYALISKKIVQ